MCLPTISCRFRYFDLTNIGKLLLRCITLSLNSPHNLHIGDTSWPSVWYFIEFTCSACSCAAHIIASVSFLRCPPFNHCQFSLCSFSLHLLGIYHGTVFPVTDFSSPPLNAFQMHPDVPALATPFPQLQISTFILRSH